MTQATRSIGAQRLSVWGILLVGGILSLPLSAYFLDGQGTENYILPVALIGMAVIGAAVGAAMPAFAGADATQARGALVGAVLGVVMSVVGVLLFWLLISGFSGA